MHFCVLTPDRLISENQSEPDGMAGIFALGAYAMRPFTSSAEFGAKTLNEV